MNKTKKSIFLSLIVLLFLSCSKDETSSTGDYGTLSLGNIGVSTEVISTVTTSRSAIDKEETEDGQSGNIAETKESDDPLSKYVENGFKLAILATNNTPAFECTSYDDFIAGKCNEIELRAGNYKAVSILGDSSVEGFDVTACYGDTVDVFLSKGESQDVSFECKLYHSILNIKYTENFKNYFSSYSTSVSTVLGNNIVYGMDEARAAYFAPGKVSVSVTAQKEGTKETTFNVGDYVLNSQYQYELTLDVDAASATMEVTFSENIDTADPVIINVSDEALNANPPVMTGNALVSGEELTVIEGEVFQSKPYVSVNAEAKIASCIMTTSTQYLIDNGWPAEVDLVSTDDQTINTLKNLGLDIKGLRGIVDQMAYVNFTEVIRNLPKETPMEVRLSVTDRYGKKSEDDFVVLAKTRACQFNIAPTNEEAPFLGNECKVDVSFLAGAPEEIKFSLTDGGQELNIVNVEEGETVGEIKHYTVTLKGPDDIQFIDPFKVSAKYLTYDKVTDGNLNVSYGILLDDGEGDMWARRAYLHVYNDDMQNLKVQKLDGDIWTDLPETEISGTDMIAKGLTSNLLQKLRVVKEGKEPTNVVEVMTEEELQIPNAGFEEWHTESYEFTATWIGKKYRDWYLPWIDGGSSRVWAVNSKKTMLSECTNWNFDYKVFPTISWSSSNKSEGEKSAQIATVATGAWAIPQGGSVTPHAGEFWLGTADDGGNHIMDGVSFSVRPSSVSFWYQYLPVSSENFYVKVELKSEDGAVIASNEITNGSQEDTGKIMTIPLNYNDYIKKASLIYIHFKSSTCSSPDYKTGVTMEIAGTNQTSHIGSVLRIDDIKLIYE